MIPYASTIFLSAFLLFQVQPLVGKKVLPWFGGTSAVWTTCMLFFQLVLLAGYAYAHLVIKRLSPRAQMAVHFGLLAAAFVFLPIGPTNAWKPTGGEQPTSAILLMLGVNIGLPYFLLSATAPLVQGWFSRANPTSSPYRLYALSNFGSLLALLSYPLIVEPNLTWPQQSWCWSIGFAVFVLGCGWCAWHMLAHAGSGPLAATITTETKQVVKPVARLHWNQIVLWLVLAALGSIMLLASTNLMTSEIPSVPLLWILPLALYLITFIIAFENERWYVRPVAGVLLLASAAWAIMVMIHGPDAYFLVQVLAFAAVTFASCFVCHGELARAKPDSHYLTLFYLIVALGGALGGIIVAVVCPLVFTGYWELPLGLGLVVSLFIGLSLADLPLGKTFEQKLASGLIALSLVIATVGGVLVQARLSDENVIFQCRNFFGRLRVVQSPDGGTRKLLNGNIDHGSQAQDEELRRLPSTYYTPHSGVGEAIRNHPKHHIGGLHLGVIGLGTGTLAAYGLSTDKVRYYEINPDVVQVAQKYFTYLSDCPAAKTVVLGDARISLEQEADRGELQGFDVLAIDAFSSDSIPTHLLTKECLDLYIRHMAPGGVIAFHISNRNLDLSPIVRALAEEAHWQARKVSLGKDFEEDELMSTSDWILVSNNNELLDIAAANSKKWTEKDPPPLLWTDDFHSLWQVLYWK